MQLWGMTKDWRNEHLKAWRAKRNLTLDAAADILNVHRATLIRWESGDPHCPVHRLDDVAEKTGLTRQQLRPDLYEGMSAA